MHAWQLGRCSAAAGSWHWTGSIQVLLPGKLSHSAELLQAWAHDSTAGDSWSDAVQQSQRLQKQYTV